MADTQSQVIVLNKTKTKAKGQRRGGTGLKASYSHTRFGCKTCKSRRIRCDETHPACRNCTKTGRECDGISQPAGSLRFTAPVTLTHFFPARGQKLGQEEVSFLDIFRHQLIDGIVGDASSPGWKRLILQAVHEEPTLCHAAVAFGALHDLPNLSDEPTSLVGGKRLALRHYNQCIKGLQDVISARDRSPNIILLCIMMCVCFELRMHDTHLSMSHLEHGLRILQSHADSVDEDLAMAFTKMDVQSSVFSGHRAPVLSGKRWTGTKVSHGSGYQQAHKDLTALLSILIGFLHDKAALYRYHYVELAPLEVHAEAKVMEDELDYFREKYLPPDSPDPEKAVKLPPMKRILWLKYLMARILLSSCLAMEETAWDLLTIDFLTIVSVAESLVDSPKNLQNRNKFSLNMGIIFPLFKTAQKCRTPGIRRRAIRLLSKIRCSEGPWEGVLCQKYGRRVMELEEEGLGLDLANLNNLDASVIPEWKRIHMIDIQPNIGERYARVVFRRRPNGLDGEWDDIVEEIHW